MIAARVIGCRVCYAKGIRNMATIFPQKRIREAAKLPGILINPVKYERRVPGTTLILNQLKDYKHSIGI
jgi:hypothetical protein